MKRNIKYNLFGWMATALLLGASSCKDDTFADFKQEYGDDVKVTFSLAPEGSLASTRANAARKISDGSKADILIYAVYDQEGNLLEDYGNGSFDEDNFPAGAGQTVLKPENGFPMEVSITLKRGEKYQLAFWAMSSNAKNAYKTADLKKVEVNYSQVTDDMSAVADDNGSSTPNNDEFRDAFCRSIALTAGENDGVQQNIHLFRPLAQINVGTSGFDYEIATRETQNKYTYSKIRINRVARYLDVVEDKTYTTTTEIDDTDDDGNSVVVKRPEAFAVVDFGWAPIPAYANMYDNDDQPYNVNIPDYPSYTKWDWAYDSKFSLERDGKTIGKTEALGEDGTGGIYGKEYFLTVHRNFENESKAMPKVEDQDLDGDGYRDYASLTKHNNKESETFKYLSMCYVLTSSSKEEPVVINNVKVWLATGPKGENEYELLNINQVPAQRNWRTNIIGNLLTEENNFEVKLDTDFAGEFNAYGPNWKWTGPIAPGVYYNGADDVIEISSKEGLIWFQKMVNGDLTVREAVNNNFIGKGYWYYDTKNNNKSVQFDYKALKKPTDKELIDRIMVATHQEWNENSGWPAKNNFHFTGTKDGKDYPATVRLMADIDLDGEEWIPIGFEGRMGEQLGWSVIPHDKVGSFDNSATDDNASGRIFYGIFDGNGHTIYNMTTKRFSADVHENSQQKTDYKNIYNGTKNRHPSDNPQWFGRGLFGQIGGNAKITNVRLNNVDIYGCNGVAGIVGIAYGSEIEITNCIVDGGSIVATPMFRGDSYRDGRTFARGVYMGGIVGYFNTDGGRVDNNIVRNVYLQAVRRAGGIIGSINQEWLDANKTVSDEGQGLLRGWKTQRASNPASISNNQLNNVVLVISSFTAYGERLNYNNKYNPDKAYDLNDNIARAGFGYNNGNLEMYSQKFVGGHELAEDQREDLRNVFKGNTESGVTYAKLVINYPDKQLRTATVEGMPLVYMPMLSSWYADKIELKDNYYGEPSAHTVVNLHEFNFFSQKTKQSGFTNDNTAFDKTKGFISSGGNTFYVPMNIPFEVDVDYMQSSPKAGVFVESVILDGKGGIGGRSVITPVKVNQDKDDCVMYITARDRFQFGGNDKYVKNFMPEFMQGFEDIAVNTASNKIPTIVKNVVLRGEPYANNGILLAPNKNLHRVELHNVAIYDVYKTLALYDWREKTSQLIWPHANLLYDALTRNDQYAKPAAVENLPFIIMDGCNLRGYTVPGTAWRYVNANNTTFERGASTGHDEEEYTYLIETETNFNKCYFKAPYIIDMTALPAGKSVTFKDCHASSAVVENLPINFQGKTGCNKIMVKSEHGKPYVEYYKDNTLLATETL
ncbi:MAG: hypothetical protein J1D77_05490 [Muribaculaceae bacterium]|nr:hypothetical protein [Muribaculaceae bacterium]